MRDLQDDDLDEPLVAFYATIAHDVLLAPYFALVDMAFAAYREARP